jgi:hypothetical protein
MIIYNPATPADAEKIRSLTRPAAADKVPDDHGEAARASSLPLLTLT